MQIFVQWLLRRCNIPEAAGKILGDPQKVRDTSEAMHDDENANYSVIQTGLHVRNISG